MINTSGILNKSSYLITSKKIFSMHQLVFKYGAISNKTIFLIVTIAVSIYLLISIKFSTDIFGFRS